MATTFNWIYLGTFGTQIDPTEGNTNAENASALVNQTFGSSTDPLYNRVTQVTMINNGGSATALDQDNNASNDQFSTNIGAGVQTFTFDASIIYNATVTYADGTTGTVTAVIAQDTAGRLFLSPETVAAPAPDTAVYEARPIVSIALTGITGGVTSYTGMGTDRTVTGFDDGYVEGTAGNDLINAAYVEPIANGSDRIDNGDGITGATTAWQDDRVRAGVGNDTVLSGLGDDYVDGGTGTDSIDGGDGNDSLFGGTGVFNDTILGGIGNDTLDGGDGDDSLLGGAGIDSILGGLGNDYVDGGTEADSIDGGDGNDSLYGGTGVFADTILGGAGADTIDGDAGNDSLLGDAGTDSIRGGLGDDYVDGGTEADSIDGGDGNDSLYGGAGVFADTILGGIGNDTIDGGDGNDSLLGGAGADSIQGGLGDDYVDGGTEADSIDGGDGNDSLLGGAGVFADTILGGLGNDTIDGGDGNDSLLGGGGVDSIRGGLGDDYVDGGTEADSIDGGDGNDSLYGGAGVFADTILGGIGNDTIDGGDGNDSLLGGAGVDSIQGGLGDDYVDGGTEADSIDGGAGNDSLLGGAGTFADTIFGGTGNDTINGGDGADLLTGGDGDDVFQLTGTFGNDTITGGENGESAGDTIDSTAISTNQTVTFSGGEAGTLSSAGSTATFSEIERFLLGAGNDTVNGAAANLSMYVDAGGGNDTMLGGSASDTLLGGTGNDTIDGGAGNDSVDGGDGDDSLRGGAGVDTILGGIGNDTVDGGTEADSIDGGAGNDSLLGGAGVFADTIFGGTGNDTINGGDGADVLTGGDGNDVFQLTGTFGDDTITGGEASETIGDTIDSTAISTNQTLTFSGGEAGTLSSAGSTATFSEIERFLLGAGNDTVDGAAANLSMFVDAGAGNDSVRGGSVDDILAGGTGNDTIDGGAGADILTGGDGDDRFILSGTFGNDNIVGGEFGETAGDTIDSSAVSTNQTVTFTGGEAGTLSSAGSTATFSQIENFTLGAGNDTVDGGAANLSMNVDAGAGNDSVLGGSANDTLLGGTGNDTISGGGGNDLISGGIGNDILNGGAGADTMTGGLGSDRFTGITAGDVVDGSEDSPSNENDILDLFGSGWNKANTTIVFSTLDRESGTVYFFNPDGSPAGQMSFTNIETVVPCFTPGTMIETDRGPRAVETLALGDMVMTMDHGLQPIRWIGRRDLTPSDLALQPKLRPILIREGALGAALPARDMRVSPQHRLLMTGAHAELIAGEAEALAPALYFVGQPGIVEDAAANGISYIHLMFDRHEIVQSDGLWSESFQPGAATMSGMDCAQRDEILSLFPGLPAGGTLAYPAARSSLKRHEVQQILAS
ncbi:MAG TPA: Hint domain-containing protein [Albidovulum sp.]|uniref:Hint domain-containing protein n=1 Tax=Albidovulum sp. TaxID=1872424 RepID=UPI002D093523|nr:Hint domain-containing protein [Albidovulum sp.]